MSVQRNRELHEFAEATKARGEALERGDHRSANRAYDRSRKAALSLQNGDDRGEASFVQLLSSDCLSTRMTAAFFLLPLRELDAIRALEDVVRLGTPLISFSAEMILAEWRRGALRDLK